VVDRLPRLHRWRGVNELAEMPRVTDEDAARLLALLCDTEIREHILAQLAPGVRAIIREELRR